MGQGQLLLTLSFLKKICCNFSRNQSTGLRFQFFATIQTRTYFYSSKAVSKPYPIFTLEGLKKRIKQNC